MPGIQRYKLISGDALLVRWGIWAAAYEKYCGITFSRCFIVIELKNKHANWIIIIFIYLYFIVVYFLFRIVSNGELAAVKEALLIRIESNIHYDKYIREKGTFLRMHKIQDTNINSPLVSFKTKIMHRRKVLLKQSH